MEAKTKPTIFQERILLHEQIPLKSPLVIYIEPSGYCNLKCNFCPHGIDSANLIKNIMPLGLFEKFIHDISYFNQPIKLLRICGNGEPLLNKNIIEMARISKMQKNIQRIELVTNGLLLSKKISMELPHFLDRIIISIEGLSENDYFHRCNARVNFQQLIENITCFYSLKKKCIVHIKIIDEAIKTENQKELFFKIFGNICDEIFIEKVVPMWPQLNLNRSSSKFRWGGEITPHKICAQIFKSMQIQSNGEVVPCCVDWKRINLIGDINTQSLLDIWNSEKLFKLQIIHLMGGKENLEPCKDCSMNDYCETDNIDFDAELCLQRIQKTQMDAFK